MNKNHLESFQQCIQSIYAAKKNRICLGSAFYDGNVISQCPVNIALKSFNRHGLIAGATGTGKTKTLQVLTEQLANNGVATVLMDMKGDLSGLAMPGVVNDKITHRQTSLGLDFKPQGYQCEFLSLGKQEGVKLRATLLDFGPLLLARMLDLNETQSSILSILFQYAKENSLLLLELADLKQLMQFAQTTEGKQQIESEYGGIAAVSLKAILRRIIELEAQGGGKLFGEPSFDIDDLMRVDEQGRGVISLLRLLNVQDNPKLFSTFMLGLLTDIYRTLPEVGDPDKPKLVLFIDEAHLIFKNATKALLDKIETMVKLIRSKGVGLFFCTQSPKDIPSGVLSQLGLKIQHALRAFTAKDRKAIKLISENFPISDYYDVPTLLTSMSIGEALISALDEKGQPTPLVASMLRAPQSRMGPLTNAELMQLIDQSALVDKYHQRLDRESALEVLKARQEKAKQQLVAKSSKENSESGIEKLSKNTLFRQIVRTIVREVTRALMSVLGIKKSRRKRKK